GLDDENRLACACRRPGAGREVVRLPDQRGRIADEAVGADRRLPRSGVADLDERHARERGPHGRRRRRRGEAGRADDGKAKPEQVPQTFFQSALLHLSVPQESDPDGWWTRFETAEIPLRRDAPGKPTRAASPSTGSRAPRPAPTPPRPARARPHAASGRFSRPPSRS